MNSVTSSPSPAGAEEPRRWRQRGEQNALQNAWLPLCKTHAAAANKFCHFLQQPLSLPVRTAARGACTRSEGALPRGLGQALSAPARPGASGTLTFPLRGWRARRDPAHGTAARNNYRVIRWPACQVPDPSPLRNRNPPPSASLVRKARLTPGIPHSEGSRRVSSEPLRPEPT